MKKPAAPKVMFADSFLLIALVYSHVNLANLSGFQDPTKPKAKKRTERAEDKVPRQRWPWPRPGMRRRRRRRLRSPPQ